MRFNVERATGRSEFVRRMRSVSAFVQSPTTTVAAAAAAVTAISSRSTSRTFVKHRRNTRGGDITLRGAQRRYKIYLCPLPRTVYHYPDLWYASGCGTTAVSAISPSRARAFRLARAGCPVIPCTVTVIKRARSCTHTQQNGHKHV